MLYRLFASLATLYTVFAVALIIVERCFVYIYGEGAIVDRINRLAGTRNILAFQIYSYASIGIWVVLVLPWVDLFTLQKFAHFTTDDHLRTTLHTYFGSMNSADGSMYFFLVFVNILGVKAAMTLAELAGMLRKGRVRMMRAGFFRVFVPE